MPTKDPALRAANNRRYYEKNKARVRERTALARERNAKFVRDLKESTPCADCGKFYPWYVMDFDHLRDKIADVGTMATQTVVSLKTLQEEIDKCEIVCSNCHRVRTFTREN